MTTQAIRSEIIDAKDRCQEVTLPTGSILIIPTIMVRDKQIYEQVLLEQEARLQLPPGIEITVGRNSYVLNDGMTSAIQPQAAYHLVTLPVGLGVRFLNGCYAFLGEARRAVIPQGTEVIVPQHVHLYPKGSGIRMRSAESFRASIVINHDFPPTDAIYRRFDEPSHTEDIPGFASALPVQPVPTEPDIPGFASALPVQPILAGTSLADHQSALPDPVCSIVGKNKWFHTAV